MADVRVHDDVAHAVDDAGVHQHEPISLEVDARFGAQLDHRGDLPRERPAEREAESGCELPRWIVQRFFELAVEHERERVKLARDEERKHDGLAGLRESLLGPVRRRELELWIHRDGNAAALVAIEVELPADRSRPDAGLVTLSGLIGGGNRVLHDSRDQLLMCVL
jgi:hypothetical protein